MQKENLNTKKNWQWKEGKGRNCQNSIVDQPEESFLVKSGIEVC
jgi:hypothetical protein